MYRAMYLCLCIAPVFLVCVRYFIGILSVFIMPGFTLALALAFTLALALSLAAVLSLCNVITSTDGLLTRTDGLKGLKKAISPI